MDMDTTDSRVDMSLEDIIKMNRRQKQRGSNVNFQNKPFNNNRRPRGRTPLNRNFVNNRQRGTQNQRGQNRRGQNRQQVNQNYLGSKNNSLQYNKPTFNQTFKQNQWQNYSSKNKSVFQAKQVLQRQQIRAAVQNQYRTGLKMQVTSTAGGARFRKKNYINRSSWDNTNVATLPMTVSIKNNLATNPRGRRRWGSRPFSPGRKQLQQQQPWQHQAIHRPQGIADFIPQINETSLSLNERFSGNTSGSSDATNRTIYL